MAPGRRRPSSPAPEPNLPLEDEDLLGEYLLRLPPQPSSLPRASLVCKQWGRLVSDPHFLRRFRGRHAKPPLLGFFSHDLDGCKVEFTPALDPPDRVPPARFSLRLDGADSIVLGCRHGRVLAVDWAYLRLLIWDPAAGDRLPVAIPPVFNRMPHKINGAIVCAAGDESHTHGDCRSNPFQGFHPKFDLGAQSLAVIEAPPNVYQVQALVHRKRQFLITPAHGGVLGFLVFSVPGFSAQLWKRDDVAGRHRFTDLLKES
ncbi:hypothetical protein C2845_PM13G12400 [Panicum miliaceum]|uniref:F-box domain-containing protein n=1 Tax=Panicum miliaceum TaxID=4540 RepID=A0A3L6RIF6_PANMI|nr:hypothetical protein C2845_PM13G12400 [Panicum miliaceum]